MLGLRTLAALLLSLQAVLPARAAPLQPATWDTDIPKAMASVNAKGLAVAVIDEGKVVYVRSFGQRNAQAQPLQTDTVMTAASLTKPAFAYVVMQLVDEGKLNLDTPIASYLQQPLPSYPAERPYAAWDGLAGDDRWKKITPRMLLSHRAGFANFQRLEPDRKAHIHFEPGTRYAYSGDGINLLQFVLEQGLGLDVAAEMQKRVFTPYGMARSTMRWQADPAGNQAEGFLSNGQPHAHAHHTLAAAAWSMDTTIDDYARFAAAFVRGDGLVSANRASMTTAQGPISTATQFPTLQDELPPERRRADLAAGLGVVVFKGPQGPGFYKGGHDDATGNMWVCLNQQQRCVLLLSNDVRSEKAFPGIVQRILGDTGVPWTWEYGP